MRESLVEEGRAIAGLRRDALKRLIQIDPQQALAWATPRHLREGLPDEIRNLLEHPVNEEGEYMVCAALGGDGRAIRRVARTDHRNYDAFVFGRRLQLGSSRRASLVGIAVDDKLVLEERPVQLLDPGEFPAIVADEGVSCRLGDEAGRSCAAGHQSPILALAAGQTLKFCCEGALERFESELVAAEGATGGAVPPHSPTRFGDATGHRSVLWVRLGFPESPSSPLGEGDAHRLMVDVNRWMQHTSFGRLAFYTTVSPLVVLPRTGNWYRRVGSEYDLRDDAFRGLAELGYTPEEFHHVILAYRGGPGNFQGLAVVGGRTIWLKRMDVGTVAHEIGHNLGVQHANAWDTGGESVLGNGANVAYGNPFDTMGGSDPEAGHFNGFYKHSLNWLPSPFVAEVRRPGRFVLHPMDGPRLHPGKLYGLRVAKDAERSYWLARRALFPDNRSLREGVVLNWTPWSRSDGGSQLLDTTPGSPGGWQDSSLTPGRTFSDEESGIHLTVLPGPADTPEAVEVVVEFSEDQGNRIPVVEVMPAQVAVGAGEVVRLSATASDPDGDPLTYFWDLGDGSLQTSNQAVIDASWAGEGLYVARCVVSDMKGGVASFRVVVTVGSTTTSSVAGSVTQNGAPLPHVHVWNGASGAAYRGTFTDGGGSYLLPGLEPGQVELRASLDGRTIQPLFSNPLEISGDLQGADFVASETVKVAIHSVQDLVTEGGQKGVFRISRTGDALSDLHIPISRSGLTLDEYLLDPAPYFNLDVFATVLTIPQGQTSIDVSIEALDDVLPDQPPEGPEVFTIRLRPRPEYVISSAEEASVTVYEPGAVAPVVSIEPVAPQASEPGGTIEFKIRRRGPIDDALEVHFGLTGDAVAGQDYEDLARSVTIPPADSSAQVNLKTLDDSLFEGPESLVVTLESRPDYVVSSTGGSIEGLILDDDVPTVELHATDALAAESGASPGTILVTRSGDLSVPLEVRYSIGGSADHAVDYLALTGAVSFPAGADTASITIVPIDDTLGEPTQEVTVRLSSSDHYVVGEAWEATVEILDDDRPVASIWAPDAVVHESGPGVRVQVGLRGGTGVGSVPVSYSLSGTARAGDDYELRSGTVLVPGSGTATIDVVPIDDQVAEDLETVVVSLSPDPDYELAPDSSVTLLLVDDDQPMLSISPGDSPATEGASSSVSFYLERSGPTTDLLTVHYRVEGSATNGVDYLLLSGTAILPAGASALAISTPITPDNLAEGAESVKLTLEPAGTYGLGISSAAVLIPDEETPIPVIGFGSPASEVPEDAAQIVIPVMLDTAQGVPVSADYAVRGGSATGSGIDYRVDAGTVVFAPGETAAEIVVEVNDDPFPEPAQTLELVLVRATGAALGEKVHELTIRDNDAMPPVTVGFAAPSSEWSEGRSIAVQVSLSRPASTPVRCSWSIAGARESTLEGDILPLSGALTIPAGHTVATIPLTLPADAEDEGVEVVEVSLNSVEGALPWGNTIHTIRITDMVLVDTDGDFLPDSWEALHGFDPVEPGVVDTLNGPLGDGDGDGLNNFAEFVLMRDPWVADDSVLETLLVRDAATGEHHLTVTFRKRLGVRGVLMSFEQSGNLVDWTSDPAHFETVSRVPEPDGLSEMVTVRMHPSVEGDAGRARYLRLGISGNANR